MPRRSTKCRSAAHRVLSIPELLEMIFSFGTQASNASYALVCRGWRELALDNVWREVDDIYYLLQLLAPLDPSYKLNYALVNFYVLCSRRTQPSKTQVLFQVFSHILTPEDWTRFIPYARRVHSLKCGTKPNEKAKKLSDDAFYEVARIRTTLEVLPNLRSLWWDTTTNARHATLFMHDKVTEFKFYCENLPSLRPYIVGRMPSLRSLRWTDYDDSNVDQGLLRLLSSLQKLREVTPPRNVLSGKLLKELSLLPELEVIQFDALGGIAHPGLPFKCKLQKGAFPKLYDLCLSSNLDDIRVYLTGGALLPRLRNLLVESMHRELPLTVQQFLTNVTRCYPTLEMVSVSVVVSIKEQEQDECNPLSPEHLHPLLSLKQLTRLELRHNQPLRISEVDLAEFGAALPALENLVLNPEPLQLTRPKITLHSLLIVAQHFPKLFYLGIYLDAEDTTGTIHMPNSSAKTRLFPDLLTLHVGVSPIASDVPVAIFLSHILSESERVEIKSGISWNPELSMGSVKYSATVSERGSKWDRVAISLPPLLQLRKEVLEKARRREGGGGSAGEK
jgi:hypothetical protein